MFEKSMMLFDLMIKGEDLSPYYPQNSGKEEFIELSDERTYFDTEERRWKLYTVSDPVTLLEQEEE